MMLPRWVNLGWRQMENPDHPLGKTCLVLFPETIAEGRNCKLIQNPMLIIVTRYPDQADRIAIATFCILTKPGFRSSNSPRRLWSSAYR